MPVIIAGLCRCSFIDFPGTLSAVLFVHGCNLRCAYCHNPSLLGGPARQRLDDHEVLSFLASRRGQLGGVVITGGEPTLADELRAFIQQARALGFKVKLDTNGTLPDVIEELLGDGLLDFVAMDLKDLPEAYPVLCRTRVDPQVIRRSIRAILTARIEHEFRTTVVTPHHDIKRLLGMASDLEGARSWVLQQYRPGSTLMPDPPFVPPDAIFLRAMASRLSSEVGLVCSCRESTAHRRDRAGVPPRMELAATSGSPPSGVSCPHQREEMQRVRAGNVSWLSQDRSRSRVEEGTRVLLGTERLRRGAACDRF